MIIMILYIHYMIIIQIINNDSYDMYLKANYSLSDYQKWEYSTEFLGKK